MKTELYEAVEKGYGEDEVIKFSYIEEQIM